MLTTFDTDDHLLQALRNGAAGFLVKDTPPADIVRAIELVAAGESMLSPTVTRKLIDRLASDDDGAGARHRAAREQLCELTDRDREIALAVAEGKANAAIAAELHLSVATDQEPRLGGAVEARSRQPRPDRAAGAGRPAVVIEPTTRPQHCLLYSIAAMPKMKTHSGAKKRFKLTANGKVRGRHAYTSHILEKKSPKRKRHHGKPAHDLRSRCAAGQDAAGGQALMTRVKRSVNARKKRRATLKMTKGFRGDCQSALPRGQGGPAQGRPVPLPRPPQPQA